MARPDQVSHGHMHHKVFRLREDVTGRDWHGHGADPEFTDHLLPKGSLVKVVMVSRFGDCGITDNLTAENGYIARVCPELLDLAPTNPGAVKT